MTSGVGPLWPWGDDPRLAEWALSAITSILVRGKQTFHRSGHVTTEAETGVVWLQLRNTKDDREPSETRNPRGKNRSFPGSIGPADTGTQGPVSEFEWPTGLIQICSFDFVSSMPDLLPISAYFPELPNTYLRLFRLRDVDDGDVEMTRK